MNSFLVPTTAPLATITEPEDTIPGVLLGLLERRYLNPFTPEHWTLRMDDGVSMPILQEVTVLGTATDAQAMPVTLSTLHEPGQTVLSIMYTGPDSSGGFRHHRFFGSRRQPGGPSTADYLHGFSGTIAGHFPGLQLAGVRPITEIVGLRDFLRNAPVAATVTGIPALKVDRLNGLDVLARSIGNSEYAIIIAAEPLPIHAADTAIDACRRLQTEISGQISRQVSRTNARSENVSPSAEMLPSQPTFQDRLPMYLQQSAMYLGMASGLPALALGGIGISALMDFFKRSPAPMNPTIPRVSESSSESASLTMTDATVAACHEILTRHINRIRAGRGWGWWRVAVYLLADSQATLQTVGRSVRSASAGEDFGLDPIRVHIVPTALVRQGALNGQIYTMQPNGAALTHPLGTAYDALATCLSSQELSALMAPPRLEVPGLVMRDRGDFPVTSAIPMEPSLELGILRDTAGAEYGPARLTARNLNEHLLVVGTPGTGKTNTCMNLLIQADAIFQVPFLVIEPAKTEYRRLTKVPGLGPRVRVYTPGSSDGRLLHLNPLCPAAGASLMGHVDALKAVFNASFSMGPGLPQILEHALKAVYEDRGWNIVTGANDSLGPNPGWEEVQALTPCLADLYDQVEVVTRKKGYGGELKQNLGAALKSRLEGLMFGAKGMCLNSRSSTPTNELFDHPVVLELQHLKDPDEQSFVMALVFMLLAQHCEVRQRHRPSHAREQLQHVTLIEEAHRLLGAVPQSYAESADPRGKAVTMFTDMLAELRALGEGFVIADQIPSKLAPDTLKNTNTKILHRLTSPADRILAGQSVNLTERQTHFLGTLSKGLAVIHGLSASAMDHVAPAMLVQMKQVKGVSVTQDVADLKAPDSLGERQIQQRHGGCQSCPSPCDFFPKVEPILRRDAAPSWVKGFVHAALAHDIAESRKFWTRRSHHPLGESYCEITHRIRERLMEWLAYRGMTESREPRLRVQERILVEKLSAAFGRLIELWLSDKRSDEAFATFVSQSRALLDLATPPDLPGCQVCPARCEMLTSVTSRDMAKAGALRPQSLPRVATDAFGKQLTAEQRLARVLTALPTIELATAPQSDEWRRNWRYCLLNVVQLPADQTEYRVDLLEAILKNASPG